MTALRSIDVVTIGESMVLFQPSPEGTIPYASLFASSVGGAESNVALALSRLGKTSRWISRLGDDPFGKMILSTLAGEGVDVSHVITDDQHPTAVFFKESKGYGDPNVYYYRKNSAASYFSKEDISSSWFLGAKHLHVTGITPALGLKTAEMVSEAMKRAKEQGLTISFDPNIRKKLWREDEARETLLPMVALCDLFIPGIHEVKLLVGERANDVDYAKACQHLGPQMVAMKLGSEGAYMQFGNEFHREPAYRVNHIVDTVGAGDAFCAGLLSVLLDEEDPFNIVTLRRSVSQAAKRAAAMGALATQFKGDWEGSPTLQEINSLITGDQYTTR
ncbi:sugar kinase [Salipaludibacillus agaradhaerens]|uniref:sugar kinase n=1 Tax=Salipaludibacillus agaradhaerens TaxID=76935 RepID=UPI002151CF14|nr:sugar kinase [Salipaludibacillus agaradhaerens]MCR6107759.1 sugar kinase [Salipaludibacillus agaradhaerens]MCR6119788.1 sugar kinase [Salipaludibacillus agaradhaerens]